MASIVDAVGYSLGKLHAGLIAYLCDLHREGQTGPLEQLFHSLGIQVPTAPVPRREWNSVDLAIFDGRAERTPAILIELKVDDHEHETRRQLAGRVLRGPQTRVYAEAYASCPVKILLTLGIGESYGPPAGPFRWVRTEEFCKALAQIATTDPIIVAWHESVQRELALRRAALENNRADLTGFRGGAWNLYLLGAIRDDLSPPGHTPQFRCYPVGAAPDTILNLGWDRRPAYLEINNNGRLNLKVALEAVPLDQRSGVVALARARAQQIGDAKLGSAAVRGASKTVASFDVGLLNDGGLLRFATSRENTVAQVRTIYQEFHQRFGSERAPSGE